MSTLLQKTEQTCPNQDGQNIPSVFKFYILQYLLNELANKKLKSIMLLLKMKYCTKFILEMEIEPFEVSQNLILSSKNSKKGKETSFKRKMLKTETEEFMGNQYSHILRTQKVNYFIDSNQYTLIDSTFSHQSSSTNIKNKKGKHLTEYYQKEHKVQLSPINKIEDQKDTLSQLKLEEKSELYYNKTSSRNKQANRSNTNDCCFHQKRTRKISINLLFVVLSRFLKADLLYCFKLMKESVVDSFEETDVKHLSQEIQYKRLYATNLELNSIIQHLKDEVMIHKSDLDIKTIQLKKTKEQVQRLEIFCNKIGRSKQIKFAGKKVEFQQFIHQDTSSRSPENMQFKLLYKEDQQELLTESKINKKRKTTLKRSQLYQPQCLSQLY